MFRLHGAIVAAGDVVAKPLGLSSARWQVMGAIEATGGATVSDLARRVGVSRQSVQRIVTEMAAEGQLELRDNPRHRRARTVVMTERGWRAYRALASTWKPIAERMDWRFGTAALGALTATLATLRDAFRDSARGREQSPDARHGDPE